MRIKEVAKRTGLTEKTIRYYESVGLVVPDMEMKDHRVWRDYSEKHARLLSVVATLRRASFRVEEIALLLTSPEKIPETVEKVYQRVEATRAEAEKLCARLAQPDLREAPDVMALARQLEGTASGFSLPPADRSFRASGTDRPLPEPRSLSASLAVRFAVLAFVLWLLSMGLLTSFYAKDLGRQAARVGEETLEAFFNGADAETASLPEVTFRPAAGILTGNGADFPLAKAALLLDEKGIVIGSRGFRLPDPASVETVKELVSKRAQPVYTILGDFTGQDPSIPAEMGLAVWEGKLSLLAVQSSRDKWQPTQFGLTFRDAPKWGGSFPSHEIDGDYPDVKIKYNMGLPVPGERHEPSLELLDGIESGAYHFDADGVLQGSRLRGAWLRDEGGRPVGFLLAAYGWSPLAMAFRLLSGVYLASLALFLLLGLLLWLSLRRSLVRPLKAWDLALGDALLEVSPEEFDYACRYRELQELAGAWLLRRQMLSALPPCQAEGSADLLPTLDTARRKLLPMIGARRLDPVADYRAEGAVAAAPEALENALLALIREALPYGEQDEKLTLRTMEKEGFLLAEAEVRTKWFLRSGAYAALWEGVYRLPADSEAPGARLRKASAAIPGSFCAVRKTKHGLVLTLGLPKAGEQG